MDAARAFLSVTFAVTTTPAKHTKRKNPGSGPTLSVLVFSSKLKGAMPLSTCEMVVFTSRWSPSMLRWIQWMCGAVEGAMEGAEVGASVVGEAVVGDVVGDRVVGEVVGEVVGDIVGESVGDLVVGEVVGDTVGDTVVGETVGDSVGETVGDAVVGDRVGATVVGETVVGELVKVATYMRLTRLGLVWYEPPLP